MNTLQLPNNAEAIRTYRQWQKERSNISSETDKREYHHLMAHAQHEFINDFIEETLLHAVNENSHSESLLWFWFNHFNVFWHKGIVSAALPDYINTVIRPHTQGSFKDLLLAVLTHPAMLVYLDNGRNIAGHINENYARELLELHTLGVNGGYTQNDVKETARVLTGVGLRPLEPVKHSSPLARQQGEFRFSPAKHETGIKRVLGHEINGQGFDEIETLVNILSNHPATARYISTKLAVFLLGDNPPVDSITQASKVFSETNGDIAKTIAAMTANPSKNPPHTFKDPYRYLLSAVRLLSTGIALKEAKPLARWLNKLGQPLFGHHTPDGYSLYGKDWLSAGQLTQRFQLAPQMVNVVPRLLTQNISTDKVLAHANTQMLVTSLSKNSRDVLAKASDDKERLALLIASPEFMLW